jgi:hypothetical protein
MPVEAVPTGPIRRGPGRTVALVSTIGLLVLLLAPAALFTWAWLSPTPIVLGGYTLVGPRSSVQIWALNTGFPPAQPPILATTAGQASDRIFSFYSSGRLLVTSSPPSTPRVVSFRQVVWQWGGMTLLGP